MRRAAADTNIWASALLNPAGHPAQILTALRDRRFTLMISEPLLAELAVVLARPRIVRKYAVTDADANDLASLLRTRGLPTSSTGAIHLARDPDDDVLIETALRGGADTLVSRDEDLVRDQPLIDLLASAGIEVLTVQRFLDALAAEPAKPLG